MKNNPDELFDEYRDYFSIKSLQTKIIDADTAYYRGRIGNEIIHGSYDECSYNFLIPYYKQEMEAPPSLFATGGRFNRSGTSYLYLSDTIETCLAEVHLPIGQNCSVGEFRCAEQIELIDLTQFKNDPEMENWLKILIIPIMKMKTGEMRKRLIICMTGLKMRRENKIILISKSKAQRTQPVL